MDDVTVYICGKRRSGRTTCRKLLELYPQTWMRSITKEVVEIQSFDQREPGFYIVIFTSIKELQRDGVLQQLHLSPPLIGFVVRPCGCLDQLAGGLHEQLTHRTVPSSTPSASR